MKIQNLKKTALSQIFFLFRAHLPKISYLILSKNKNKLKINDNKMN